MASAATTAPSTARERVFCHECRAEWYRDEDGLVCPNETCRSDFVEIIENNNDPRSMADLFDFDGDGESDDEDDHRHGHHHHHHHHHAFPPLGLFPAMSARSRSPGGTTILRAEGPGFSYVTARTTFNTTSGGGSGGDGEVIADLFSTMLRNIVGDQLDPARARTAGTQGGAEQGQGNGQQRGDEVPPPYGYGARLNPRNADAPQAGEAPVPLDIQTFLNSLFGPQAGDERMPPMFARLFGVPPGAGGDYVYSQAELDRIVSQLMEQHAGNAPPPAAKEDIDSLPRLKVTAIMVTEGVDCAVCKDDLVLDEEVAQLPCKHTYHFECVSKWLEEHDTCPICRHPITPEERRGERRSPSSMSPRQSGSPTTSPGAGAGAGSAFMSGGFPFLSLFGSAQAPTRSPQATGPIAQPDPSPATAGGTQDRTSGGSAGPPGSYPTEEEEETTARYPQQQTRDGDRHSPHNHQTQDSGSSRGPSAFANLFRRRAS